MITGELAVLERREDKTVVIEITAGEVPFRIEIMAGDLSKALALHKEKVPVVLRREENA